METFLFLAAAVVVVVALVLFGLGMFIRAGRADDDMDRWFARVFGRKGGDHGKKAV